MTILETLSGLLNSRRQARDLIAELAVRGYEIVKRDSRVAIPERIQQPLDHTASVYIGDDQAYMWSAALTPKGRRDD